MSDSLITAETCWIAVEIVVLMVGQNSIVDAFVALILHLKDAMQAVGGWHVLLGAAAVDLQIVEIIQKTRLPYLLP